MAISTQTQDLINFYNQKKSLDAKQLEQINFVQKGYTLKTGVGETETLRVWGQDEIIDNYTFSIKNLDSKILELNSNIVLLQREILELGESANAVGCGTTGIFEDSPPGFTTVTVFKDQVKYKGYTYSGNNPFEGTEGDITSENIGIGTFNEVVQVSIGSYFGPINQCNGLLCLIPSNSCTGYADSISELENQIPSIRSERDDLIETVNFLKKGRSDYELQNYSYEQAKSEINTSIQASNNILEVLKDPDNSEFL